MSATLNKIGFIIVLSSFALKPAAFNRRENALIESRALCTINLLARMLLYHKKAVSNAPGLKVYAYIPFPLHL